MVCNVRDRASNDIARVCAWPVAAGLLALIVAGGCTLDSEGAAVSNAGGTGTGGTSTGGTGGTSTGGTGGTSTGGTGGTSTGGTGGTSTGGAGGADAGPDVDASAGAAGSGGDAGPEADVVEEPVLGELGDACTEASACQSGHCVDDVCCESACDGACVTCSASGACVPSEAGQDPDGDCGTCETCDGSGSCASCLGSQVCVSTPEPQDCATADVCVDCSADSQCGTGRCEGCACVLRLPAGQPCDEDTDCVGSECGPGISASPLDCATADICVECEHNYECTSGRCADCLCASKLGFGSPCVETSDCVSALCGPAVASDANDCAINGVCAECDADYECATGRCDGCSCLPKLANGEACNEVNDCSSNLCGPAVASDALDCAIQGECVECDGDYDCGTQRCDGCVCVDRLGPGEVCDEDTDCVNNNCLGHGHCN